MKLAEKLVSSVGAYTCHEGVTWVLCLVPHFSFLRPFSCSAYQSPWTKYLCSIIPFHHDISALDPASHGLNPPKLFIKLNFSSFKLYRASIMGSWVIQGIKTFSQICVILGYLTLEKQHFTLRPCVRQLLTWYSVIFASHYLHSCLIFSLWVGEEFNDLIPQNRICQTRLKSICKMMLKKKKTSCFGHALTQLLRTNSHYPVNDPTKSGLK